MVPELAEYIFNSLKDEALRKLDESGLMKEFNTVLATYVITHMNVNPVEVLVDFKVSYEDMKRLIQTLHGKGVTSKFLDKQPYVIVVDVEAFDKEIVEILKELEDKLISL
ncbi:MAG: hypothetical protein OWQ48_03090 [Desulfurococcus sp.]|nr:hypothetical protein [Desulfurococcus sp.]